MFCPSKDFMTGQFLLVLKGNKSIESGNQEPKTKKIHVKELTKESVKTYIAFSSLVIGRLSVDIFDLNLRSKFLPFSGVRLIGSMQKK